MEKLVCQNEFIEFEKLVGAKFYFEIGSATFGGCKWNKDDLTLLIKEAIKHNLFDFEFYFNWSDWNDKKDYTEIFDKDVIQPLLKNIDKTLNDMFRFYGDRLVFTIKGRDAEEWRDKWFQSNTSISKSLKHDYYAYRDEYAGVQLL